MEPASKVSASAFSLKVRDKKDLYELASRNGFFLPSYKSRAVTEDYLIGILRNEIWCPRAADIRIVKCVKPPTVDVLLGKFREVTLLYGHDKVYISDKRPPDAKWLVAVVGTLLPDDEIFAKGYVPPPRRARQADAKLI